MGHSNFTATCPIENWTILKSQKFRNISKTTGKKILAKDWASNPLVKPPPGDKTLGIDLAICFYELEDVDDTE